VPDPGRCELDRQRDSLEARADLGNNQPGEVIGLEANEIRGGQSHRLRGIVRIGRAPRTQTVAEREGDVVCRHDFADIFEMRVQKVLLVVREAPLRQDRSAARMART